MDPYQQQQQLQQQLQLQLQQQLQQQQYQQSMTGFGHVSQPSQSAQILPQMPQHIQSIQGQYPHLVAPNYFPSAHVQQVYPLLAYPQPLNAAYAAQHQSLPPHTFQQFFQPTITNPLPPPETVLKRGQIHSTYQAQSRQEPHIVAPREPTEIRFVQSGAKIQTNIDASKSSSQTIETHGHGLGYTGSSGQRGEGIGYRSETNDTAVSTDEIRSQKNILKPGRSVPSREQIQALLAKFAQKQEIAATPALGWAQGTRIPLREKNRLSNATERNLSYVKNKDTYERRKRLGLLDVSSIPIVRPTNLMYQMGGQARKAGLGVAVIKQAHCGVYIDGLPPTVSQEQLEGLFSAHGPIRRVKIYMRGGDESGSSGIPKGDALVTFIKAVSVDTAIPSLSGYEIAPGFKIKVSRADFSHKEKAEQNMQAETESTGKGLPEQCNEQMYPVVVLHNVFAPEEASENPDQFYEELEGDMLQECIRFGTVKCVVTLEGQYEGSVAVTFSTSDGAKACASAMHGRWFDGRQIQVEIRGKFEGELNSIPTLNSQLVTIEATNDGVDEVVPDDLDSFLSSV